MYSFKPQKSKKLAAKWRKLRELRREMIARESRYAARKISEEETGRNRPMKLSQLQRHSQIMRDLATMLR